VTFKIKQICSEIVDFRHLLPQVVDKKVMREGLTGDALHQIACGVPLSTLVNIFLKPPAKGRKVTIGNLCIKIRDIFFALCKKLCTV